MMLEELLKKKIVAYVEKHVKASWRVHCNPSFIKRGNILEIGVGDTTRSHRMVYQLEPALPQQRKINMLISE